MTEGSVLSLANVPGAEADEEKRSKGEPSGKVGVILELASKSGATAVDLLLVGDGDKQLRWQGVRQRVHMRSMRWAGGTGRCGA